MSDDLNRLDSELKLAELQEEISIKGGGGGSAIYDHENGQSFPQFKAHNSANNLDSPPKLPSSHKSKLISNPLNSLRAKARSILRSNKESCQAKVIDYTDTPDLIALRIASRKPLPSFYILPLGSQPMLDFERYNKLIDLYTRHYHHSLAFELLDQIRPNSPESLKLKSSRDELSQKIKALSARRSS